MIKKISGIAFSNILYSAFSFLFIIIIINYLGKDDFAKISILVIYSQFITMFGNFSLDNGLLRFYDESSRKSDFVSTILIFSISSFLFTSFLLNLYIYFTNESVFREKISFYFVIILSLITILNNIIKSVYLAEQNIIQYTIFILASVILPYIFSYVLLIYFTNHLHAYIYGYSLGGSLLLFITFLSHHKKIKIKNIVFKRDLLYEPLKFSILIIPGLLSSLVISSIDKIYLSQINESSLIADVNVVNKVVSIATLPSLAIVSAFYPHYLKLKKTLRGDKEILDSVLFIVLFITLGFIFFTIFSAQILQILFPAYSSADYLLYFYNLSGFISVLTGFLNFEYYHHKKTDQVSFFIALSALLNIALIYLLIPYFGVTIVGVVSLVTSFANFLLLYVFISKFSEYMVFIKNKILHFILFLAALSYLSFHLILIQKIFLFVITVIFFLIFFKNIFSKWRRFI